MKSSLSDAYTGIQYTSPSHRQFSCHTCRDHLLLTPLLANIFSKEGHQCVMKWTTEWIYLAIISHVIVLLHLMDSGLLFPLRSTLPTLQQFHRWQIHRQNTLELTLLCSSFPSVYDSSTPERTNIISQRNFYTDINTVLQWALWTKQTFRHNNCEQVGSERIRTKEIFYPPDAI